MSKPGIGDPDDGAAQPPTDQTDELKSVDSPTDQEVVQLLGEPDPDRAFYGSSGPPSHPPRRR